MLNLFKDIIEWRREKHIRNDGVKFHWGDLHLSIVRDYYSNLSTTCEFRELPHVKLFDDDFLNAKLAASFTHQLDDLFMVPRLKKFDESENRVKKYQLVEAFISFLLQLLDHTLTYPIIRSRKYRFHNLKKDLRFLLTILGDASLMLCDDIEREEFQSLVAEFEAVANGAGSLVHMLLFSKNRDVGKMKEGLGVISNHIHLLKANIMKFSNLVSSAHITPKSSVADSLVMVDSLVYDLEDLMKREDNRIAADVKDQIKILHQGLIFLQSSINDIGSPRPSEIGELKEPLMRIGDMAHEAEYLIISFMVRDAPLWYLINRLTYINHNIEHIGTELQEITKKYTFGDLKIAEYLSAQPSLLAKRNTEVDDVAVGFEDKATYILDQLVGGGTERLQVITIYGMPGLGKTTLAKKLYNQPLVNNWFDKQSWCVVSQTYQRQSILAEVLICIKSDLGKDRILKMEEESLVEHIYKTLKGRRYLVVMDDMWDSNVWDDLRRCFPDDENGSRILLTSRNLDVAPPKCIIYPLPSLSNDQSWELLEKKVFDNKPCPTELLGIGKKIAANCCGLPLAVVVIAGILSTVNKEKSTWEEVGANLASYILDGTDNSVKQILELSYKHLPDHLKPCFLYFGALEEHKEIPVGNLMRLWIAEGFVRKATKKSPESTAEEYLLELIDKSLVMVAKRRSDGGVKACVIHDLLHDLCLKKSEEENFLKFVKSNDYSIYKKGHRLQELQNHVASIYCQHVRSLRGRGRTSPLYVRDMRLLRVLHFDHINTHYIGVEYLINLRYLVITDLPESVCSLVNLEYLRVETDETVYLPPAILKMRKLRYLEFRSDAFYDIDRDRSQTNNLEFLYGIVISKLKDEEILKCSPKLGKLKCKFDRSSSSVEKRACRHFDLRFLARLDSLNIKFCGLQIAGISFPSNIRKLTLSGSGLPWEKMWMIGRLEKLEVLKLGSWAMVGERWDTRDGEFQELKFLKLGKLDLVQWNVDSANHFPRLQRLVLSDCYNLEEIPCEIGEIATLEMIEVKKRCSESLEESAKRIQQEQWDMGNEELRIIFHHY